MIFVLIKAEKNAILYFYISALCSMTDGQSINRIDVHVWEEYAQKKKENSIFVTFANLIFVIIAITNKKKLRDMSSVILVIYAKMMLILPNISRFLG